MKNILEDFIRASVKDPKEQEIKTILTIFEEKTFKKGEFFKEPFTIGKEFGFLVEGKVRQIFYKEDGEEITLRLLQENSFIADVFSIRNNQNTPIGIECLDDVSMLVAPIEKFNKLLDTNLALNILIREYTVNRATEMGRNYLLFLTGNATDRYQFIVDNNPDLLEKFPLQFIASIIGVTPTQLSRIRNPKKA